MSNQSIDGLWTDKEAAAFLQTNLRTLRAWRELEQLPCIKITRRTIRYRKSDLEAWLERRRVVVEA